MSLSILVSRISDIPQLGQYFSLPLIFSPQLEQYMDFLGYVLTFDRLLDTSPGSGLAFRPLEPRLETKLYLVWKKYQPPIAERFLTHIKTVFSHDQSKSRRSVLMIRPGSAAFCQFLLWLPISHTCFFVFLS